MTEYQRMTSGELYDASDPELVAMRLAARQLLYDYNHSRPDEPGLRQDILQKLMGGMGTGVYIEPPFYCDYGSNIALGDSVYMNFGCIILDPAPVTIGPRSMFGPNVQILTATHPVEAAERDKGPELAGAISIGASVWVGGGAIICPGVTVGDEAVIAAGAVVVKDVAPRTVVGGNPARVIRTL